MDADAAFPSSDQEQGPHRTVWTEPPKRPAGRIKYKETRHPLYRGVRRRGLYGRWVCEVRVRGTKETKLWLGTFRTAEMAARAHDSASLALSGSAACLNFADSAWRMQPVLADGSSSFSSAREIKDAVAVAVVEFQRQRPVSSPAETADHEDDAERSPTPSAQSMSSDLLAEHWFDGMDARPYYSPGMFMEPPERRENGELGAVETPPLWSYFFD